ncbi:MULTISPECIES: RnfABCDGE type electron transport complex subunit D [unclassified Coleofasciculus]|uniref:RnfABCDGE type electron transport complex subunit D n=1 Tax=unclassified Coleofasciculus TaxID=2692782 RepID=UPI00187F1370|nr:MULTISPECIES: RnfABCDGE type electron transport complex subunit D [unclassified Coleofasciculus]MBE9129133.1 RnfABCDGE type electron transport complex subunit D [Coleofasciculus sp. LEGE 07081]MBE9149512.1 RnfABCDGE type electron transport complex subunit D [Coleofasciculus sp. LEGE 07092]
MLRQDPRDYQILFLLLFLILGIGTRDWTIRPDLIVVVTVTCLLTQWVAASVCPKSQGRFLALFTNRENFQGRLNWGWKSLLQLPSLKSAAITALGLSLLLRSDRYTTMILAGILAILSKFIFQVQGKHFFNPANFGIISVLILTNDAWVSPGQWGDDGWYALLFAGMGGMILKRVGRWDTTAAFLGVYALLEAVRNLWLGWTWDVFSHRLMSGSLLLFALFMLTDPRSIPNARSSRLLWAGCIAIFTFILRNQFFITTAVFWALFALAPLTVLLDFIWSSPRFSWNESSANISSDSGEKELTREKEAIV